MADELTPKDVITAIKTGDIELLEIALKDNEKLLKLATPLGSWLHIATEKGQSSVVEFLLNLGIDINVKGGPSSVTPLNTAAYEGYIDILDLFLAKGAEMDVSEPDRNPLFAAIHAGHIDVAKKLLEHGIDATVKYSGQSMQDMDAIAFCAEWGRKDIAKLIEKYI